MSQKLLKKLQDKKYRDEMGLFLVEGRKGISELLKSDFKIKTIYTTLEALMWMEEGSRNYVTSTGNPPPEIICVVEDTLAASGTFRSNNAGIAIAVKKPERTEEEVLAHAESSCVLVLDDIRDPGNLGTIVRTADWFGITSVVVSPMTTDWYSPKTINASMGSFTRVSVTSLPLLPFLKHAHARNIPSLGAFLQGENIYTKKAFPHGLVVLGSESHGIHPEIAEFVREKITIPRIGGAESLNVATATGILLAHLTRP